MLSRAFVRAPAAGAPFAAPHVGQIGSEDPVSRRAADAMTIDARLRQEHFLGLATVRIVAVASVLPLVRQPALEVLGCIDVNAQQHVGVLRAAEFGALTDEQSGALRL